MVKDEGTPVEWLDELLSDFQRWDKRTSDLYRKLVRYLEVSRGNFLDATTDVDGEF
jgi:hypothetical protein